MKPQDFIKFSVLSRFLLRSKERGGIRENMIPAKHAYKVARLIKLIKLWMEWCELADRGEKCDIGMLPKIKAWDKTIIAEMITQKLIYMYALTVPSGAFQKTADTAQNVEYY
jgi:hypothetical protein